MPMRLNFAMYDSGLFIQILANLAVALCASRLKLSGVIYQTKAYFVCFSSWFRVNVK